MHQKTSGIHSQGKGNDMRIDPMILVVEDDEGHFHLLKRELKRIRIDWPIRRFSDGQQAMDFFGREFSMNPNEQAILLLDLRLPKVSGTAILAWIRSSGSLPLQELPIVVITSSCNPDDRTECEHLGCNGYLTKPFSAAELLSAIHSVIPGVFLSQSA
jgi:CheY-like chemotaxis protein